MKKLIILLFVKNEESSKLVLSITSTSKLPAYLLKGYLLVILTLSKNGSILLNIWYLVNLLDLLGFSGKNGSIFDNSILVNFLEDDGSLDIFLVLIFFFFYYFLSHYYKKVEFLIILYFYSAKSFFLYYAQKIVLKI